MTTLARLRVLRLRWLALLGVGQGLAAACGGTTYVAAPCEVSEDFGDGTEMCEQGYRHRKANVACGEAFPAPPDDTCATAGGVCASDADCIGSETCAASLGCSCVQGCQTDADCGSAQICDCEGEPIGRCIDTGCRTDADCEAGFECVTGEITFFFCQQPGDECTIDQDCPNDGDACLVDSGTHVCVGGGGGCDPPFCQEGRPFLVDGRPRTARIADRSDWSTVLSATLDLEATPADLAEPLSAHWAEVGLMEHASIAAFARLSLQLLSLGAPPDLVARAASALGDETEHARIAFALASAYGRRPIGPGPLAVAGALEDLDLETLVRLAIREGCVGETSAAMLLEEGAIAAASSPLRALLASIAADETSHAELAWLTLRWALEQERAVVSRVIQDEMAILQCELRAADDGRELTDDDARLSQHGVLGEGRFAALRRHAIRELVLPILGSLTDRGNAQRLVA